MGPGMFVFYLLGWVLALGLAVYLCVVLFRAERF
jgi:K+-transporting ATPase KdpF subunit